MRRLFFILSFSCLSLSLSAQTVYLKPAEALKVIFKDSKEVISEKKLLSPEQKKEIEKHLGTKLAKEEWTFYIARSYNRNQPHRRGGVEGEAPTALPVEGATRAPMMIDGYALIDHEIGKTEPITFITAITPQGEVKAVEILVYREPIGSEVHDKRFVKQYKGKRTLDPIRVGQDITNISGATMSARAVSIGVKRALVLWELFYGKK